MYKKREINKIISHELKEGNKLAIAISKTPIKSKATFYQWMDKNPRLKQWVKSLESLCDNKRNAMVEDAFYERLSSGKATGAEYFFYLSNRMPNRWVNKYNFEHSGEIKGQATNIYNIVSKMKEGELADYFRERQGNRGVNSPISN